MKDVGRIKARKGRIRRTHWWRRVLQDRGKWKPADISNNQTKDLKTSTSPAFTEIQIRRPKQSSKEIRQTQNPADGMMQIVVGERYRIGVPSGFDCSTLDRILGVLEGRSC